MANIQFFMISWTYSVKIGLKKEYNGQVTKLMFQFLQFSLFSANHLEGYILEKVVYFNSKYLTFDIIHRLNYIWQKKSKTKVGRKIKDIFST